MIQVQARITKNGEKTLIINIEELGDVDSISADEKKLSEELKKILVAWGNEKIKLQNEVNHGNDANNR